MSAIISIFVNNIKIITSKNSKIIKISFISFYLSLKV